MGYPDGFGCYRDILVDWTTVLTNTRVYVGGDSVCGERKTLRTVSLPYNGSAISWSRFALWFKRFRHIEYRLALDWSDVCDRNMYCVHTGVCWLAVCATGFRREDGLTNLRARFGLFSPFLAGFSTTDSHARTVVHPTVHDQCFSVMTEKLAVESK